MTLNRVKIEPTVTFMKYLTDVVSLIFQPKTLIWNKIKFAESCRAGGNEFEEYFHKPSPVSLFLFILLVLM